MKIDRPNVLQAISDFVESGNGVIIGIPGIGKTHTLSELVIGLVERQIPACLIRLDALRDGSDEDISKFLGIKNSNWLEELLSIEVPQDSKGVLIFDAFDAVRDENLKKRVLQQIENAKAKLPQWSIIASVRTYDALNSPRLIELFPQQLSPDNIHCRKYVVPHLSDEELKGFLSTEAGLCGLYSQANERLKQLFRVPFFLSLLNLILSKNPEDAERLSVIKSEIELLDLYWVKVVTRVEPTIIAELFLRELTNQMIADRQLTVDKYDYLSDLESSHILIANQLLSENVLSQQGFQSAKIGFAHNILFDYAVSKLIIKDSVEDINAFLQHDTSRILFLRPSFVYFFTRLWHSARERFWEYYEKFSAIEGIPVQLFIQLVPTAVFVSEFEQANDLPAVTGTEYEKSRTRNILRGLLYLECKASKLERAKALDKLSHSLQLPFAGEFAMVLHRIVDSIDRPNEAEVLNYCGKAARNLFDYVISNSPNWDQLIAYHVIPLVAITFETDIAGSKSRLEQVLKTIESPDFYIKRIAALLDNLQYVYLRDADFVQEIYLRIFQAGEQEDKPTTILSSVMLNFTMSRRDEFSLCRYRLQEFFPTFLAAFPERAIVISLQLIELFVGRRNDGHSFSPEMKFPLQFEIHGVAATYLPDMSTYWSEFSPPKEIELLDKVLEYFNEIANDDPSFKINSLIDVFLGNARSAISWKRFLAWSVKHANKLHRQLYDIFLQPIFLYWTDTIQEVGELLDAVVEYYSEEQIREIENAILSTRTYVQEELKRDCESRIVRLLSRIPLERLQLEESRQLISEYGTIENSPIVESSSFSQRYTERMFMSDKGVDLNEPINNAFMTTQEELDAFHEKFRNDFPPPSEYEEALKKALLTFESLKTSSQLNIDIAESVLSAIASVCSIVARSDWKAKSYGESRKTDYGSIKEVLLACVSRHSTADIHAESHYSPGHIYTSTPKSEAAAGLTYLILLTGDSSLVSAIESVSKDRNPIARFGVTKSLQFLHNDFPELFWKIMLDRIENESDNFILGDLVLKLYDKKIYEDEHALLLQALVLAQPRVGTLDIENVFLKNFLLVALKIYRLGGEANLKQLLVSTLYEHLNVAPTFIYDCFEIIQPANHYRRFDDETDIEKSKRLLELLMDLVDHCAHVIGGMKADEPLSKEVGGAFEILNDIIRRVYYSLQVNQRVFGGSNPPKPPISEQEKTRFYLFVKPLLEKVLKIADKAGLIQPGAAYLFIQILNDVLDIDAEFSLYSIKRINELVSGSMYHYDHNSVSETVKFAERLLADHRDLLMDQKAFAAVVELLNIYAQAGWTEALELLRRLDEIFR